MQPSMFNVQVPVKGTDDVFLMNTLSDAQLLVSSDVSLLLDRIAHGDTGFNGDERDTIDTLIDNGFIVESRNDEQRVLGEYFTNLREDAEQMKITVLTTLQCNFACDYCFQGDHGDYNKFAAKMSLDTARRVAGYAGIMAAQSLHQGCDVDEIDIEAVQKELDRQGVRYL